MPMRPGSSVNGGIARVRKFVASPRNLTPARLSEANQFLVGVTRDSVGAPLGNCLVYAFRSDFLASMASILSDQDRKLPAGWDAANQVPRRTLTYVATTASDGSGAFSIGPFARNSGPYFLAAWDAAGTVAGITLSTLQPPA